MDYAFGSTSAVIAADCRPKSLANGFRGLTSTNPAQDVGEAMSRQRRLAAIDLRIDGYMNLPRPDI
jgi:hypothetical protein